MLEYALCIFVGRQGVSLVNPEIQIIGDWIIKVLLNKFHQIYGMTKNSAKATKV